MNHNTSNTQNLILKHPIDGWQWQHCHWCCIGNCSSPYTTGNQLSQNKLQSDNPDNPEFKWIGSVQNILNGAGFSYIWNAESLDLFTFKENFSQRCNDIFLQNWQKDMQQNSQCSTYKLFKHYHEMEDYLVELADVHKFSIAKFRTRTHHLPITRSRFKDYTVDVTCPLCPSGDIGDECHYLFRCKFFEKQREKFYPGMCLPSNLMPYLWAPYSKVKIS